MRSRLTVLLAIFFMTFSASAQEWRLEIGMGYQPIHMVKWGNSPDYTSSSYRKAMEEKGQEMSGFFRPNIIASVVWQRSECWEWVLTGEVCWNHFRLTQYEQFGFDPEGKPRYNLNKASDAGCVDSYPISSGTLQWRYHWNPWNAMVRVYSGFGVGLSAGTKYIPTPSITPIGIRMSGRHIYGFLEVPVGPFAYLVDGGLGWTF